MTMQRGLAETKLHGRNDGLDAVRSCAIALVLAAHGALHWLPVGPANAYLSGFAGFLGVNLFFSLSGFLIGGLVLRLAEEGATAGGVARFWARRWLRTLPLYYLVLAAMEVLTGVRDWHAWLFLQNFPPDRPQALVVGWSLVLEEFFYLVLPLLVWGLARLLPRQPGARLVLAASLLLILACTVARLLLVWGPDDGTTHVRPWLSLDSCAYGVVAAWAWRQGWRMPGWLVWLALAVFAFTFLLFGVFPALGGLDRLGDWAVPFGIVQRLWLHPAAAAVLIPVIALRWPVLPPWLATPLRVTSLLSYGLYLVHVGTMLEVDRAFPAAPAGLRTVLGLGLAVAVAWLLHRAIEQPVLRLRDRVLGAKAAPRNARHRA
jgi:peptidoglycan/LPS O-acetylase OafA/YrhL